ncbi:MAG: PhnD/SsuA/transferrin family substrate-binding protein [Oscillospiraceae bacterium]|nr:PhnD/SsuA/transferrin family substrate-binding protein [Oscillospiraceae bacterium]
MKRFFSLLLCTAMLFSLISCGKDGTEPPVTDSGSGGTSDASDNVPAPKLDFETLNVELAIEGAEVDALMTLGRELDALLEDALEAEGVEVDDIHVTFGTSSAATTDALRAGNVQLAWLPVRTYVDHAEGITPVLGVEMEEGCYIYAAPSDAGHALGSDPTWDEISGLSWGLQQEYSLCGFWYPTLYLADKHDGRTTEDLENAVFFESFDDALESARRGEVDVVVTDAPVTEEGVTLLAEFSPVFSGVVAVTNANEVVASDAFCQKLEAAVLSLCKAEPARGLLQSCGQDVCRAVTDADFDPLRRIFSMGY